MNKLLTKFAFAALLLCCSFGASAQIYQKGWVDTSRNGEGVSLIHQANTIGGAWYFYDANRNPAFLIFGGNLLKDSQQRDYYTGPLNRSFGDQPANYNPANTQLGIVVGTVTIVFNSTSSATMTFSFDNGSQAGTRNLTPFNLVSEGSSGAPVAGYALGTAQEISQVCSAGATGVNCRTLEVTCPEIPAIQVQLRINEPTAGVTNRGTIIFGTGGGGTGFYSQTDLFKSLQNLGFRVIDRAWNSSWTEGGKGVRKGACRYATLATWIHANLHNTGSAFCGTGNSGGAAEVGHAMVTYGREAIFDYAMPTGGPAVARLDYACHRHNNAAWLAQCDALIPKAEWQCTPSCTISPSEGVCMALSATATDQELLTDSVLAPDGVYQFPRTKVGFIEGTLDCQVSPVMGVLFHNTVQSAKSLQFVRDTPHTIISVQAGRDAMLQTLNADCVPRH